MTTQEFATFLDRTLDDMRLSRNERRVLTDIAAEVNSDEQVLAGFRKQAFERAAAALGTGQAASVLEWLEGVLKALQGKPAQSPAAQTAAEVYFSPGEQCCRRLVSLLGSARRTVDICVFTITDDRISSAVLAAHRRGVKVRIITDDEKSSDLGSDIAEFRTNGIQVRMDNSTFHMHHKFAIVDGSLLLNGSFNWTRSASMNNQENFVLTGDQRLIAAFSKEFEKLWSQFEGN
jgi:mitochondrial cardiolipin hydrolase